MRRGKYNVYLYGHNRIKKRSPVIFTLHEGEPVALIPLSTGDVAIIDADDEPKVSELFWTKNPRGYAMSSIRLPNGRYSVISLHRFIMNFPKGDVDHRRGILLDCRKSQLRPGTHQQNGYNQKPQAGRSSRFKGVSFQKCSSKWESYIKVDGKKINLGLSIKEIDAAILYNKAAVRLFGEFAQLNKI